MRILHVAQYFMPWMGYQEKYLAEQQLAAGHDVLVAASTLRSPGGLYSALTDLDGPAELPVGSAMEFGIPTHRMPVRWTVRGRLVLSGLRGVVERFDPDVVHAHSTLAFTTFQVALMRKCRFRLVVDEHQLASQSEAGRIHGLVREMTAFVGRRILLPRASAFVGIAQGCVSWLTEAYGFPRDRVSLIPLGADVNMFRPDRELGLALRTELGIPPSQSVVLYSGKITPHKRIDLLVQALAGSPALLLLVGPADPGALVSLSGLASSIGVSIRRCGAVPPRELVRYFNAADVCAWPADCTISHIEAAACGKPIVIPDDPGVAERVSADNGFRVQTGDVDRLRAVLTTLLGDPALRDAMGTRGRALVLNRFSWRSISDQWLRLYCGASPA